MFNPFATTGSGAKETPETPKETPIPKASLFEVLSKQPTPAQSSPVAPGATKVPAPVNIPSLFPAAPFNPFSFVSDKISASLKDAPPFPTLPKSAPVDKVGKTEKVPVPVHGGYATEAEYRTAREAAGEPVSVNRSKAEPSFGGNVLRSIFNPFLRGLTSIERIGENATGLAKGAPDTEIEKNLNTPIRTPYTGDLYPVGYGKDFNATDNPGRALKDATAVGLEAGSNFVGGEGAAGAVEQGLKGAIKRAVVQGAKTGAGAGALSGAGEALGQNGDFSDVLSGAFKGAVAGAATGAVLEPAVAGAVHLGSEGVKLYKSMTPAEREAGFVRLPGGKDEPVGSGKYAGMTDYDVMQTPEYKAEVLNSFKDLKSDKTIDTNKINPQKDMTGYWKEGQLDQYGRPEGIPLTKENVSQFHPGDYLYEGENYASALDGRGDRITRVFSDGKIDVVDTQNLRDIEQKALETLDPSRAPIRGKQPGPDFIPSKTVEPAALPAPARDTSGFADSAGKRLTEKYPDVKLSINEGPGSIQLHQIIVPEEARSQGTGTQVMEDLARYADEKGKRITLTPSDEFGGDKARLVDFYNRFGFLKKGDDMVRFPGKTHMPKVEAVNDALARAQAGEDFGPRPERGAIARSRPEISAAVDRSDKLYSLATRAEEKARQGDLRVLESKRAEVRTERLKGREGAVKAFDTGVKSKIDEAVAKARRSEDIYQAHAAIPRKNSFFSTIREALAPGKYLEKDTRGIFNTWENKLIEARSLANKEAGGPLSKIPKGEEGWQSILDYEVGKPTKWTATIKATFDKLYKEGIERGLDTKHREDYIPHIYEDSKANTEAMVKYLSDKKGMTETESRAYVNGRKLGEEQARRLSLNPFFTKERIFPTYKSAMEYGLMPKFTHPDQLAAAYREQLERNLANRDLIDGLLENHKILLSDDAPKNWDALKLTFSPKGYYAEPLLAKTLNKLFTDPEVASGFERAFKGISKVSKFMQEMALSGGVPHTNINFYSIGQAIKDMTAGRFSSGATWLRANFTGASRRWLESNQGIIEQMAKEGIDLSGNLTDYKKAYKNTVLHDNQPFLKKWKSILGEKFDKAFNENTFSSYMPQVQIQLFKDVLEKATADGIPKDVAQKLAGDTTKNFYGLIDKNGRAPGTENILSSVFFAPKFREGIVNTLFNTAKSITTEIKNPTFRYNRRLFAGMALTYAAYNALNYKLNGNFMWQNPAGRESALRIPGKDGNVTYIEFMPSFLSFARNMFSGAIGAVKGDFKTATQKFGSLASMPVQLATETLSNKDYFGNPIYQDTDTLPQKLKKIAIHAGLSASHPYIKQTADYLSGKQPLYQALSNAFEIPLKFGSLNQEQKTDYYNALDAAAKVHARENEKIMPVYQQVQQLSAENRTDEAQKLLDSLTDDEYEAYKRVYQSDHTKQLADKKVAMVDTVQQVQALQKKGDTADAQKIVDSLSDADYKVYSSVYKMFPLDPKQKPEFPAAEAVPKTGFLASLSRWAKAVGVDPSNALEALFTKEQIAYVNGNVVVFQRMPYTGKGSSEDVAQARANTQGVDRSQYRLDHTIPLEMGGDNSDKNLNLITQEQWASYTPIENLLGSALRNGTITRKKAQDLILRFKTGMITADEVRASL